MVIREVCFVILVSLTQIMWNILFVHFNRWSISSKFLFKEHALIWNNARNLRFSGNFIFWIWSVSKYLKLTIFSASFFFSGEMLLNWLYRRARLEGGFSERKVSLSLSLLVPWKRVWWKRDKVFICYFSKSKDFTATRTTVPGIIQALETFLVNVVKFIRLHMSPWLTNITLNCRICIIDVYLANFSGVHYIFNIYENTH